MLLCVTASHKTARFDLLERLSRHPLDVAPSLVESDLAVQGAVLLSTCNRFEAYVDLSDEAEDAGPRGVAAILTAVVENTGIPREELAGSYEVLSGREVAEHLFAVASGLESVVAGEGEIAGQVRRALLAARSSSTTSPELERLFQRASHAQRKVKNVTALGRAGRSLVRLSLELADSRIADWSAERALLIGTGAYAAVTLAALRERGVADVSVYSPSGRATRFAAKHGIRTVDHRSYSRAVQHSSLIITCTSSADAVLDRSHFGELELGTSGCPVGAHQKLVIDLGMPRNVDPAVGALQGVALLDLETIRLHAPLEELQATDAARGIVREAADTFQDVGATQSVTPAVIALRSHVLKLLEAEIERAQRRGDDEGKIEQALRHLAGVLLHTPTSRAQQLATQGRGDEFVAAIDALYGLTPVEPAASSPAEGDAASA